MREEGGGAGEGWKLRTAVRAPRGKCLPYRLEGGGDTEQCKINWGVGGGSDLPPELCSDLR